MPREQVTSNSTSVIAQLLQAERVDPDRARLTRDFLSLARQAIQSHAVFLESREHRRHLLQFAANFFSKSRNSDLTDARHRPFHHDFSRAILSVGFDAENHHAAITFYAAEKDIGDLGAFVDADEQQTRRKRIQRAEMADFLGAQNLFDLVHDLSRRRTFRLIDQQNAVSCHHKRLWENQKNRFETESTMLRCYRLRFNRSSMRRASSSLSS